MSKLNNTLIITGGNIDYEFAKDFLTNNSFDIIIAVDKGLEFCYSESITPDYIMGDFDSIDSTIYNKYRLNEGQWEICLYDSEKDYTDTHLAVKKGIEIGSNTITILGGTGTRIDHVLSNIGLLIEPLYKGVLCYLIDVNNKIYLINKDILLQSSNLFGDYVSLYPLTDKVTGITLIGFKYPLFEHTLRMGESICISNEVVAEEAIIHLDEGILIVIESKD